MADRKMIAARSFRYGTRMLQADAEVTMPAPRARLHEALGDVRPAEEVAPKPEKASAKPKRAKRKKAASKK